MKKAIVLLLIFKLQFSFAQTDNFNFDFEDWDESTMINDSVMFYHDPFIKKPYRGFPMGWTGISTNGVHRTTDAYKGKYAIIVHMWYALVPRHIALGTCNLGPSQFDIKECRNKINLRPINLRGVYKYINKGDSAIILMNFYKKENNVLKNISTVHHRFPPKSEYTNFDIPITYNDTTTKIDSFNLQIITWNNKSCQLPMSGYCEFLYLDDLSFEYNSTDVNDFTSREIVPLFYPNPANDKIIISSDKRIDSISICSTTTTNIFSYTNLLNNEIDISYLPKGLYIIKLYHENGNIQTSKFVKI